MTTGQQTRQPYAPFPGNPLFGFRVEMETSPTGVFGGRGTTTLHDITNYVFRCAGKRGRDTANTPLGFFEAGRMVLTLNNQDDRFTIHRGTPTYPDLRNMTPIIFSITRNGGLNFVKVATMYLDNIQYTQDGQGRKLAQFTCLGLMAYLNQENTRTNLLGITGYQPVMNYVKPILQQAFKSQEVGDIATYWEIDNPGLQFVPASLLLTEAIAGSYDQAPSALSSLRYIERVENGVMYETGDGKLAFRSRRWRWNQRCEGCRWPN